MTMTDERVDQDQDLLDNPTLALLRQRSEELNEVVNRAQELRDEMDELVWAARKADNIRYKGLAIAALKSVAWVQSSLTRTETRLAREQK